MAPAGEIRAFIEALHRRALRPRTGSAAEPRHIQITAGATHALACAMRTMVDPHDEVLILSPYWPLVRGQVLAVGARPVEVPFSSRLHDDPDTDLHALIHEYVTPRTTAIYVINPNNPDGKVLRRRDLEVIAEVARSLNLWVLSDEVYEEFAFDGRTHVSLATLPGMFERTCTAFSFSKTYGQAGLRVGYLVGSEAAITAVRKLSNHTIYSVPRAMQNAALAALEHGEPFIAAARQAYKAARDVSMAALSAAGIPGHAPEGGSYIFINLSRWIDERGAHAGSLAVLEKLAMSGILLAPGEAFGKDYRSWARFCYTAVPRDRLDAGLAKIIAVLDKV